MTPAENIAPEQWVRFWVRVSTKGPGECWLWQGSTLPKGYGIMTCRPRGCGVRRWEYAHRLMFLHVHGHFPLGVAGHTCHNPGCVHPRHVVDITQSENIRQGVKRGTIVPGYAKGPNPAGSPLHRQHTSEGLLKMYARRRENVSR